MRETTLRLRQAYESQLLARPPHLPAPSRSSVFPRGGALRCVADIAASFEEMAGLHEVQRAKPFRIGAYRTAAESGRVDCRRDVDRARRTDRHRRFPAQGAARRRRANDGVAGSPAARDFQRSPSATAGSEAEVETSGSVRLLRAVTGVGELVGRIAPVRTLAGRLSVAMGGIGDIAAKTMGLSVPDPNRCADMRLPRCQTRTRPNAARSRWMGRFPSAGFRRSSITALRRDVHALPTVVFSPAWRRVPGPRGSTRRGHTGRRETARCRRPLPSR